MRKITQFVFVFLVSALTPIVAVAQESVAQDEASESRSALSQVVKNVSFHRLSNGLRVLIYKRGLAPVFSGVVGVRVGGTDESVGQTGISHMLEHMAFKGTPDIGTSDYKLESQLLVELDTLESIESKDRTPVQQSRIAEINKTLASITPTDQFTREYDIRGASGMNATTDKELTKYFVSMPKSALEFWCWIESERIIRPVMRQFYKERDVVLEERRMRYDDDPQGKLYEQLLGVAYTTHPYRNPVIGYPFDVSRLSARQVADFHKKYYVPGNIVVALVGDVDPSGDLQIVEKYFGRIPAGPVPTRAAAQEPKQEGERRLSVQMAASPQMLIAYHKPVYPDPDDAVISVMAQAFASGKVSPLYTELVKKTQIASEVSYEEVPGSAYPNLSLFNIVPKSPHTNEDALRAFDRVLNKFQSTPIKTESLEMSKRAIAMAYLGQIKSSMALALDFVESELLYDDWKAFLVWYDRAMTVTREDVARVTKKYFQSSNRTVGVIEATKEDGK